MSRLAIAPDAPRSDVPSLGRSLAETAAALMAQPGLGITSVRVVGLPEREVAHLAIAAHQQHLDCALTRDDHGLTRVALRSAAPPAALPVAAAPRTNHGRWLGWLRRGLHQFGWRERNAS